MASETRDLKWFNSASKRRKLCSWFLSAPCSHQKCRVFLWWARLVKKAKKYQPVPPQELSISSTLKSDDLSVDEINILCGQDPTYTTEAVSDILHSCSGSIWDLHMWGLRVCSIFSVGGPTSKFLGSRVRVPYHEHQRGNEKHRRKLKISLSASVMNLWCILHCWNSM